uniref:Integrase, catalytic region, zinc finger, CCHC-type, peptidase aspartic, catalytic n=1 Tax=Tanacetum cinerariifolium TaxID=118510 RepID=A0A699GVK9_TANCI|nr:integrase, catalytic region, zinc finger, CCHC-type, peptidase aspartic, catalytic [Tanacetum cinerariifolium]
MANLSEDIQCAGFDTRPPMLDRTDFASWKQHIRLYCQGKENVANILKSIDEGSFQMGTFRETLAEGIEGAFHLGPKRPRVYSDLSPEEKERVDKIKVKGTMHEVQVQLVMRELRTELGMLIQVKQGKLSVTTTTDVDCDAFVFDVDEAPTAQTMFMANLSSADPVYNEASPSYDSDILSELKVAIGYKNPLNLTRTQQVQSALYNGREIIKTNHVSAIVHNSEDTLEIAEITRKKMNDKMKDPECVKKKVKIAPHDYLKDNYLATFTPQKQLTLEQIFWSKDLLKMTAEALKEQTTTSRQIKVLTVSSKYTYNACS